jgi:ferric-dicitrate binding protein FerR (iron transport regulator)
VIALSDLITLPGNDYDPGEAIRPLSVRMTESARAQLEILADLNERSVTEETRLALEHWVEKSKSDPKVLERAEQVRAKIEREAATRRGAIDSIFDGKAKAGAKSSRGKPDADA